MADGDEVQSLVEIRAPQREVASIDARDEAVVERLGDAQGRMDAVPAGMDRELVGTQLAGVEETENLDPAKAGLEQLAVLGDRVLAQVPRVVGLLRARRGEGEAIRRRDIGDGRSGGETA